MSEHHPHHHEKPSKSPRPTGIMIIGVILMLVAMAIYLATLYFAEPGNIDPQLPSAPAAPAR